MDPKSQVKDFYETVGWNRARPGVYVDSARAEDLRPVSQDYRTACHLRINRYLPPSGKYLLDIASGPIQYPEYLTYSQNYQHRVCADIAYTALKEARGVLGEKGLYVQCDITCLPFIGDALDGIVSLHTIYHVPAAEQLLAFQEIHRVLKPGGSAAVIYSWGRRALITALFLFPYHLAVALGSRIKRLVIVLKSPQKNATRKGSRLYTHFFPYRWFGRNIAPLMPLDTCVWRSINVNFLKLYIHGSLGRKLLAGLYSLEEKFPRFFGRIGAYPLFVIHK